MKGFNKRGDNGETDLLYGGRISKSSLRVEAYGTVDEAVSALGIARALSDDDAIRALLLRIQKDLFIVGAELATDPAVHHKLPAHFGQVTSSMVDTVEKLIEAFQETTEMPCGFVLPGGSVVAAHIDLARAIVRRAERRSVDLWQQQALPNAQILSYLNRLADLLFVLARVTERGSSALVNQ